MKFFRLFTFITIFTASISLAQYNWYPQDSGVSKFLFDVHFVNENEGWSSGNTGVITHTTDGGITWNEQNPPANNQYYSIYFVFNWFRNINSKKV